MNYLLDTHALLFYLVGDKSFSTTASKIFVDKARIHVSIVCLWEIAIKSSLGKLNLVHGFEALHPWIIENNMEILDINFQDLKIHHQLPWHHKDPFDRMLIAQAKRTGYPLITRDQEILKYDIPTLW